MSFPGNSLLILALVIHGFLSISSVNELSRKENMLISGLRPDLFRISFGEILLGPVTSICLIVKKSRRKTARKKAPHKKPRRISVGKNLLFLFNFSLVLGFQPPF